MTTFLPHLRELIERATPRPWIAHHYGVRDRGGYIFALNWPHHYQDQDARFQKETEARESDASMIAFLANNAEAIAEVVEALQGEVDNCANCGGTGSFEWNLEQHKCNRCARSRQALANLKGAERE